MGRVNACPSSENWFYRNVLGQLWDSCVTLDESLLTSSFLQPTFIKCSLSGTGLNGHALVSKSKMSPPALISVREPINNKMNKMTLSCD